MTESTGDTEAANDEGASPDDTKPNQPGQKSTQEQLDAAKSPSDQDPKKVENLTKQGRDIEPDDEAE